MKVGDTIYVDYQASTPVDPRVLDAMIQAEHTFFANPHAADHALGWQAAAAIQKAAATIAAYFELSAEEIVFTSGASEANSMAVSAAKRYSQVTGKRQIFTGAGDHKSVLSEVSSSGLDAVQIPLNSSGAPDIKYLENNINTDTCMVSVIGVGNENGAICDLEAIARICQENDALFHVDMAQFPLSQRIDLFDLGISFATLSSHKVYGPMGIGALLFALDAKEWLQPLILGGGQQDGLRGGTLPTPLCVGFAEAIEVLDKIGDDERVRVAALRDQFVEELERRKLASLVGARDPRHPGNALMRFVGWEASDLLARTQPIVAASSQSACSSGEIETSYVLRAMGYDEDEAKECIRFSFGRFSDESQIAELIDLLERTIAAGVL